MNPNRVRRLENNVTQEQIKANILQYNQNAVTTTRTERYVRLAKETSGKTGYQVCESGCALTSQSDVPGPIQTICYDATQKTWNPRTRLNMPTNDYKFPYKGLVSDVIPDPPVLSYKLVTDSSVTLTWTICIPTLNYRVFKQNENDGVSLIQTTSAKMLVVNGLENGTTYKFFIVAPYTNYDDVYSNEVEVTTLLPAPLLKIQEIGFNTVSLANTNKKSEKSQMVVYVNDGEMKVNNLFVDGLKCGTKYRFYVCAEKNGFCSEKSNAVEGITLMPNFKLTCLIKTDTSVVLLWEHIHKGCHYQVYKDGVLIETTYKRYYEFSGLAPNTEYAFHIVAKTSYAEQSSNVLQCLTFLPTPVVNASLIESDKVSLFWDKISSYFKLFQGETQLNTISENTYTVNNLKDNKDYIFGVQAVTEKNRSLVGEFRCRTGLNKPDLTFFIVGDQVNFKWTNYTTGCTFDLYTNNGVTGVTELQTDVAVYDKQTSVRASYYIRAKLGNKTADSNMVEVTFPLVAPVLSYKDLKSDGSVTLTFDNPRDYNCAVYKDGVLISSNGVMRESKVTGLDIGEKYSFYILFSNSESFAKSNILEIVVPLTDLTLKYTNKSQDSIVLEWNVIPGCNYTVCEECKILKDITTLVTDTKIDLIEKKDETSYATSDNVRQLITDVEPNSKKAYHVIAYNQNTTKQSNVLSVTTDPVELVFASSTEKTIVLKFDYLTQINSFVDVYSDPAISPTSYKPICSLGRNAKGLYTYTVTIPGLSPLTKYSCYIKIYDAGNFIVTNTVACYTRPIDPSIEEVLGRATSNSVTVKITNYDAVNCYYTATCDGTPVVCNAPVFVVSGLPNDYISYKIRVTAVEKTNPINESTPSNEITPKTTPNNPKISYISSGNNAVTCKIDNYEFARHGNLTFASLGYTVSKMESSCDITITSDSFINIPNFRITVSEYTGVVSNSISILSKPVAPTIVRTDNTTDSSLTIKITNYNSAFFYKITYDGNPSLDCYSETFTITGLKSYTSYSIKVLSCDKEYPDDNSTTSKQYNFFTQPEVPKISWVSSEDNKITCKVDNYTDQRYRNLKLTSTSANVVTAIDDNNLFTVATAGFVNIPTFQLSVEGTDITRVLSNSLNISSKPPTPEIDIINIQTNSVKLVITNYDVYQGKCIFQIKYDTNSLNLNSEENTISGLSDGKEYTFKVTAIDIYNNLNKSNEKNVVEVETLLSGVIVSPSSSNFCQFLEDGSLTFPEGNNYNVGLLLIGGGGDGGYGIDSGDNKSGGGGGGGGGVLVVKDMNISGGTTLTITFTPKNQNSVSGVTGPPGKNVKVTHGSSIYTAEGGRGGSSIIVGGVCGGGGKGGDVTVVNGIGTSYGYGGGGGGGPQHNNESLLQGGTGGTWRKDGKIWMGQGGDEGRTNNAGYGGGLVGGSRDFPNILALPSLIDNSFVNDFLKYRGFGNGGGGGGIKIGSFGVNDPMGNGSAGSLAGRGIGGELDIYKVYELLRINANSGDYGCGGGGRGPGMSVTDGNGDPVDKGIAGKGAPATAIIWWSDTL